MGEGARDEISQPYVHHEAFWVLSVVFKGPRRAMHFKPKCWMQDAQCRMVAGMGALPGSVLRCFPVTRSTLIPFVLSCGWVLPTSGEVWLEK